MVVVPGPETPGKRVKIPLKVNVTLRKNFKILIENFKIDYDPDS